MAEKDKKEKDEGDEEGAKAPEAPPAGGSKKKILFIAGFVVLLALAAGIPTVIMLMRNKQQTEEVAADAAQQAQDALKPEGSDDQSELAEDEERLGAIAPLETFVVNLNGGKYLRTQIQLEFQGADIPNKFVSRLVPIRDGVIAALTKKTESELSSPTGKQNLKNEVRDIVNEQLRKEEVKRVYFTQFVIQYGVR